MTGECETCGLPLVWSTESRRLRCCVYGDHPVLGPSPLMWRADQEMAEAEMLTSGRFTKDRH